MRTDHARIVIRERTWSEILDLALQVLRTQFAPLCAAAAVGIVPVAILNVIILNVLYSSTLAMDTDADVTAVLLVMIEAPLATAVMTLYLGQAMFTARPNVKKIAREFVASLPQLVLLQVVVRTVLIVPVLTWIVPYAVYPYLNELILLERYPLFAPAGQLSTARRMSALHRGGSGDYIGRAIGAAILSVGLILALWTSQGMLLEVLFGFQPTPLTQVVSLQLVLWIVVAYFTVARFLSYLDQRIRYEGWEIELALRSQRERLLRHAA